MFGAVVCCKVVNPFRSHYYFVFFVFHLLDAQPHCGPMNLRLRIHLPLLVPRNSEGNLNASCGIRVGGQVREWEEGKAIVLDDAYEHEVWNKTRYVVWRCYYIIIFTFQ
mmetsp:Transcript_22759/g.52152  ORF Transcript_22759/g.52152 Transcript_22759/m.52152 type:complete len:109 (+) Transcript_22759:901-1227(+)